MIENMISNNKYFINDKNPLSKFIGFLERISEEEEFQFKNLPEFEYVQFFHVEKYKKLRYSYQELSYFIETSLMKMHQIQKLKSIDYSITKDWFKVFVFDRFEK